MMLYGAGLDIWYHRDILRSSKSTMLPTDCNDKVRMRRHWRSKIVRRKEQLMTPCEWIHNTKFIYGKTVYGILDVKELIIKNHRPTIE